MPRASSATDRLNVTPRDTSLPERSKARTQPFFLRVLEAYYRFYKDFWGFLVASGLMGSGLSLAVSGIGILGAGFRVQGQDLFSGF